MSLHPPDESAASDRMLTAFQALLACDAVDLSDAVHQMAVLVADLLPADTSDILLYDAESDSLVALGLPDARLNQRHHQLGLNRLPLANKGRTVEVFLTGEPYHTGNAAADPALLPGVYHVLGIQSLLMIPLVVQGVRRGVIGGGSRTYAAYSLDDLTFLNTIAPWIGVVIQRAERAEVARREAAARAHQRAATDLVNVLAHDLGNYLTPMHGRLSLVRQRALRDARERDIRDVDSALRAVNRVQRLTQDLLDSERITQGLFHLTPTLIDLMPLLHDTVMALQHEDRPLTLAGPPQLCVHADASRLRQAVENVLSNALKHTPRDVPIQIRVTAEQRPDEWWAVIHVQDHGPGIPQDVLPTLLERFTTHGPQGGLGLGLYLVHGIVQAHHGSVSIESIPGQGTTVTMAFPGADPDVPTC